MRHGLRLAAGERGNSVVTLHAAKRGVVAHLAERIGGGIVILYLGFLQTEGVGLVRRQPIDDQRQTPADRVDVPGCDFDHPSRMVAPKGTIEIVTPTRRQCLKAAAMLSAHLTLRAARKEFWDSKDPAAWSDEEKQTLL